jgi:ribulose-5-phosphate 4-epimerase/fuculose-1-phosphate aldolase
MAGTEPLVQQNEAEWQARIDLAAAHRLADIFSWTNLVYNHITLRIPGEPAHFLLKPNELLFNEVTASSLVKLDLDGNPTDGSRQINVAGFNIHTAVLTARPEINCVIHVHTEVGMAISALDQPILPLNQGAMRFYNRIAYHDYEGISDATGERERISRDIADKKVMILRHHGLLTCGANIGEAMMLMKYLIASCDVQLRVQAVSKDVSLPSPEVCEHTARQWDAHDSRGNIVEWQALLRIADSHGTDYKS